MTDTTDIKALREGLVELLDHVDSYGGKCWLFPEDVRSIISSLDQLEAERQRADAACRDIRIQANDLKSARTVNKVLQAELAALKGSIGEAKDWEIDHSTDVPILVYKKCSVIESDQAYGLLNLIKQPELKGDQVPVAYLHTMHMEAQQITTSVTKAEEHPFGICGEHYDPSYTITTKPLFTAPQKPVVKLAGDMTRGTMYAMGWNDRGLADKLTIEAAGGIVKDGE